VQITNFGQIYGLLIIGKKYQLSPGEAGAGGLILIPKGTIESSYEWSLGTLTNNSAEDYALYQGLKVATILQIKYINVSRDSRMIIKHTVSGTSFSNLCLMSIISRIRTLCKKFESVVHWFHIVCEHNGSVDKMDNRATQSLVGVLLINSTHYEQAIS
jgi:ribonuclease HI